MIAVMPAAVAAIWKKSIDFIFSIGPMSRMTKDATPEQLEKIRASVTDALAPYHTPDGIKMDSATWVVTAGNG